MSAPPRSTLALKKRIIRNVEGSWWMGTHSLLCLLTGEALRVLGSFEVEQLLLNVLLLLFLLEI